MNIAIICPKLITGNQVWGESLVAVELYNSFRYCYPEARMRLIDPTNFALLNNSYDLIVTLWNDESQDKAMRDYLTRPFKIFWMVSAPTNMQRLFNKDTNPYDLTLTHSSTVTEQLCNAGIPASTKFIGVNTRLFYYIPTEKKYDWCFLGNYDNKRRKPSFDKWLKPFAEVLNANSRLIIKGKGWNNNHFDDSYKPFWTGNIIESFEKRSSFYSWAHCGLSIQNQDMLDVDMIQDRLFSYLPCCRFIITNLTNKQLKMYNLDYPFITPFDEITNFSNIQYDYDDDVWNTLRLELIHEKYDMDTRVRDIVELVEAQKK